MYYKKTLQLLVSKSIFFHQIILIIEQISCKTYNSYPQQIDGM